MVTILLILITAAVSLLCMYGRSNLFERLQFNAWHVWHHKERYRLFSYGLVHSGWGHLFFNMLTLYFFGSVVEQYFGAAFGEGWGIALYLILYISALAVSSLWDLFKQKDNPGYNAVGHSAHFWGAVYGLIFLLICRPDIFLHFLTQLGLR